MPREGCQNWSLSCNSGMAWPIETKLGVRLGISSDAYYKGHGWNTPACVHPFFVSQGRLKAGQVALSFGMWLEIICFTFYTSQWGTSALANVCTPFLYISMERRDGLR